MATQQRRGGRRQRHAEPFAGISYTATRRSRLDPGAASFSVLGAASQLFDDQDAAAYIEAGSHLMPWIGDEDNLVDRYDARLLLSDPGELAGRPSRARAAQEEGGGEDEDEALLDEERYRDLDYDREHEVAAFGGVAPARQRRAHHQHRHHGEPLPQGRRPRRASQPASRARCGLRRRPLARADAPAAAPG
jgi:hypothetical protein